MAGRSFDQRYKSLLVLQILLKYTDDKNPLTIKEIQEILNDDYDIKADVHSIGRDIKELQRLYSADEEMYIEKGERLPYKIEYDASGKRGYKVTKRPCDFSDLQLLVECIHSSRFISKAQESRLLNVINEFCSIEQSNALNNDVFLVDRVKINNNSVVEYIQKINEAIKEHHIRSLRLPHERSPYNMVHRSYRIRVDLYTHHIQGQLRRHAHRQYHEQNWIQAVGYDIQHTSSAPAILLLK